MAVPAMAMPRINDGIAYTFRLAIGFSLNGTRSTLGDQPQMREGYRNMSVATQKLGAAMKIIATLRPT